MRLLSLFASWFWRVDAFLGGGVEPNRGQRFVAAHPVRFGLIMGFASGAFMTVVALICAALGAPYVFTLFNLFFCLGLVSVLGLCMVSLGYITRWELRHYGHYPHDVQNQPDGPA
ncbi:hypothetical protein [Nonomuraea fuscirosea]|uniref:hypothetical protein n=1 Tax=Nonomuraea fuscirosea TaxID=1291556 RepID=UPI00342ECAA1